jgi:RimJ/RimL family protein N-acetyltransferase
MKRASDSTIGLHDGTRLIVRPVTPEDRDRLAAAYAGMSETSLYRRFMSPKRVLSGRELTYFTEVDHRSHEALLAICPSTGAIVGEARYAVAPDDPFTGDVAFAVVDEYQGRGVGSALTRRLVAAARDNGIERLTASTLAMNHPARALLVAVGFEALGTSAGAAEFELVLQRAELAAAA